MTGSAAAAEDILQDGFLRLHAVAAGGAVTMQSPRSYLSTIIVRLSLDYLERARSERERYTGPWLPEPILTAADPAETGERRETISLAFLVLMEALTPEERAVFLLHEVFDYPHDEIASMLGKSPAACRQLLRRARVHLQARRARSTRSPASAGEHRRLVERFLAAAEHGDVQALAETLAQDVVHLSDGGGKVPAARRPIFGREAVARLFAGLLRLAPAGTHFSVAEVNGTPALLTWVGETLLSVVIVEVAEGAIQAGFTVVNPDKLTFMQRQLRQSGAVLV